MNGLNDGAHNGGGGCSGQLDGPPSGEDLAGVPLHSRWRHKNGNIYTVLMLANEHSTQCEYPVMVVYQGENGRTWARKFSDWHRSMTRIHEETT